jgi:hypothetical protein
VRFNRTLAEALFMYDPPSINMQKSSAEPYEKENEEKNEEEDEEKDKEEDASCNKSHDQETIYSESDHEDSRATLESRKKRQYKKRYPRISPLKSQGILQGIRKKIVAVADLNQSYYRGGMIWIT